MISVMTTTQLVSQLKTIDPFIHRGWAASTGAGSPAAAGGRAAAAAGTGGRAAALWRVVLAQVVLHQYGPGPVHGA